MVHNTLMPYIPSTLLHRCLSAPVMPTVPSVEYIPAAVLRVDVSGFTALTETLSRQGSNGLEELTGLMNSWFTQAINVLEAAGGEVARLEGDALLVLFSALEEPLGHAVRRALQAGEQLQASVSTFTASALPMPHTSNYFRRLKVRVGIGAGMVSAVHAGGMMGQRFYVIAGDPVRQAVIAEREAPTGTVLLSREARRVLHSEPLPLHPVARPQATEPHNRAMLEAVLQSYVPGVVRDWRRPDLRDWLGSLRPMTVLFLGIGGIDYAQPEAASQLHRIVMSLQGLLHRYEGTISRIAVDDNHTILLVLFGAPPLSHEDDPLRALLCGLEMLRRFPAEANPFTLRMGIASGNVFAGPVGSPSRREYTVLGNAANLAYRLMSQAMPGGMLCDSATYQHTAARMQFAPMHSVRVKGRTERVQVYRPLAARKTEALLPDESAPLPADVSPLMGREREQVHLWGMLHNIQAGHGQVLLIEGEAGIGKTRLVLELTHMLREERIPWLLGSAQSVEQQTPYSSWRAMLEAFLGLEHLPDDPAIRCQHIRQQVQRIAPEQLESVPLLNDILPDLHMPDTPLTALLEPVLRQQSIVLLLVSLLRQRLRDGPLVLIMENGHWQDSMSAELMQQVARTLLMEGLPLMLVLTLRPLRIDQGDSAAGIGVLKRVQQTTHMRLQPLSHMAIAQMIMHRLSKARVHVPSSVLELMQARTGGNPFFASEFTSLLLQQGTMRFDAQRNGLHLADTSTAHPAEYTYQLASQLPDSIRDVLLTRLDHLPPDAQLTLRAAAAIGPVFSYHTLQHVLHSQTSAAGRALRMQLDELVHLDILTVQSTEPELTYRFRHIIMQEVVYNTLLSSQRQTLQQAVMSWYAEQDVRLPATTAPRQAAVAQNSGLPTPPIMRTHAPLVGELVRTVGGC